MVETELLRTLTLDYVESMAEYYKSGNNIRREFAFNCISNVVRTKRRNSDFPIDFYTTLEGMTRDKIIFIFTVFKFSLEIRVFALDPRRTSAKRAIYKALYTTNRITRVLLSTDVVFRDVDEHLCSTVREALDNRRLLLLAIEMSDVHSMHPSVIRDMDIQIPEEVYVKKLEEDDAEVMISTHNYLFPPSTDFFRKLIRFYGGYGLCSKEDNELLSWGLITTGGTIDYVGTVEKAARKNYARTIIRLLAKELIFWDDQKVIGIFKELLAEDEIFLSVCGFMKLLLPDHYITLYCSPSRVLQIWEIPIRTKPLPYPLIELEPPAFRERTPSTGHEARSFVGVQPHSSITRRSSDGNEFPERNLEEEPDTSIPRPNYDDDDPSIARPRPLNWKPRKCYMIADEDDEFSDAYTEEELPEEKPTEGKTNPLKAQFKKLKKFGKSILIAVATKMRKPESPSPSESEDTSIEYYFTDEAVQASNDLMDIRPISPSTCTRPATLTEWLLWRQTVKEEERKAASNRRSNIEITIEPLPCASTAGPSSEPTASGSKRPTSIPIGKQAATGSSKLSANASASTSGKLTGAIRKLVISPSTKSAASQTSKPPTGMISRLNTGASSKSATGAFKKSPAGVSGNSTVSSASKPASVSGKSTVGSASKPASMPGKSTVGSASKPAGVSGKSTVGSTSKPTGAIGKTRSSTSKPTGAIGKTRSTSSKSTGGANYKLMGTKPTISKITISGLSKPPESPIRKPARKSIEPGICEMPDLVTTRNYDETNRRLVARKKTTKKTSSADKKDEKDKKDKKKDK